MITATVRQGGIVDLGRSEELDNHDGDIADEDRVGGAKQPKKKGTRTWVLVPRDAVD